MDAQDRFPIAARRRESFERLESFAGQGGFDRPNPPRLVRMARPGVMAEAGGMAEEETCHSDHQKMKIGTAPRGSIGGLPDLTRAVNKAPCGQAVSFAPQVSVFSLRRRFLPHERMARQRLMRYFDSQAWGN